MINAKKKKKKRQREKGIVIAYQFRRPTRPRSALGRIECMKGQDADFPTHIAWVKKRRRRRGKEEVK
jgi:hypothetical protein